MQMQSLCSLPIVRYQEPKEEDGLEDMTQLEDLQEAAVLSNIRTRFERQLIYTYIGSILVSVNPYRLYNIYGKEQVQQYEGRALGENPPHLFAIANVAYSKVMDAKHNQCIVISGESGSGKTEATKLILSYLAAVSQKRSAAPQVGRILEATPLLESFGNAKTVRNDNSSRFGKFVEIFLEDGLICGAITSQYLLEKSRVVFQAQSERNYHIFYEMLAGLPSQQRQRYFLQGAETYYYLNQGGNCEIPGKDDAEDFRRLLNTMEVLNFSVDEQNSIFRILSSVLHLGNVYFEKYETDCQEVAMVVSATEIRTVAELLQVSPEGLQKAITFKVTETQREKIFTPLTVESAVDARDAIAKTLYSLLFGWLTDRINKLVYPRQEALSIAILDIYGFEDLTFNSFEQLCINYANEYLQFFFNRIVFQEEQEEYIREQIEWKEIPFSDNQPCIDLISQKPYGILRILDDQSCFPQATDHTFLQKCHYHHGTNPLYTKPKMPLPEFTIKHYAGKVTYQVHKFLDKNYDQVRQDVLDLFLSSRTKVVANLFFGHAQVLARQRSLMRRSSTRTRRYKAPTVAARFQQSLLELVERMERCNPFFVRCIKPNNKKEPGLFEPDVVRTQLRYSGILETIRIRKEGYPVRIPFIVFIDRYRCLVDMWSNVIPNGPNCVEMLRSLCPVNPSMYYVGVTKVLSREGLFLKEQLYQALESKRCRAHHLAALTLQRYARTFFIKRRFRSLRRKIGLLGMGGPRVAALMGREGWWHLLTVHPSPGDQFSCPIHSWSTGEDLAGDVLKLRGLAEGWRGWSVAMKAGAQWAELAGHDYVLDLVSDLELLRGFPRQKSCFLLAWDGSESHSRDSRPVLGHGFDLDEVPPPPAVKAPTLPSMEAYHSHDGEFGEPRSQKGLDRYLDSLFDPVLSYGNGELEKPSILSQRLKGGGGVGGGHSGTDGTRSCRWCQVQGMLACTWCWGSADVGFCPGSKLFGKKLDPHEEAMQILKEQLSAARVPSPPAVGPKEVVAAVKPVPSARYPLRAPTGRPAAPQPPVFVSRELPSEAQQVQTQLHRSCSEDFYTYHNVPWKILIRKEVFYPKDNINHPLLLDLIFRQIFNDVLSDSCIRISHEERLRLKSLFAENKLDSFSPVATESVKREIIAAARDGCEVYFSRLFPATGSVGTGVQILAVSHAGIKLLRVVKGTNVPGEQLRVLRAYSYPDVLFVTTPSRNMLEFNLRGDKLILFSPKAPQVKVMVDHFITELRKDSQYVVAVRNYSPEDRRQLSFHKGDIIHLQSLEHPERDQYYGCVVRKKVMYLEELKTGTQDFGWKFGAIHGRSGLFPAEYVQPVAAPDFVHLPAERKEEPRDKQGKVAASAAVAVAVASTAAAQELDRKTEVSPASATFVEGPEGDGDEQLRDVTGACPMLAFAQKHFRAARRGTMDSRGMKLPSVLEMLTFTKIPIQESLIEFVDGGLNKLAAEAFQAVMKFMGDHPLRGQTELDIVCTMLKLCAAHEVLRDEVYCQIIKQITNNTSSKPDSCQRGWRLLYILAAYHKCSEVLRPFLLAFLQDASRHPELPFHGIAKACEQNLRKTLQFGGRSLFPSSMELKAMVAGRSAKRQLFLLPGGIERHLKIKTCSVALDVIEELCCEMGLQNPEALEEYILFVVTDRGQSVRPLTRREYVLDVAAETELRDSSYSFWCRRVVWGQPLKFDNELYVTVHYNQVLPDYLKGLFTVLPPARPGEQHFPHVAKLAALQHRAKDRHLLPTAREMQDYVPPQLFRLLKPQSWLQMVTQHVQQAQALSAHQARAQFLGLLSAYPMFGSSFFYIQSCSNNAIVSPCILAVNQNGLNFLSKETHELMAKFSLNEIQSTRTQRPTAGSSSPYVEITLGDLLAQGITQLQLEQGLELCRVVAAHMERLLGAREKRLTLPPSEITLL
nr:unconventional myosin-XV [Zonotrichia albicollis]